MIAERAGVKHRLLLSRLSQARNATDALFGMLAPEAMYERPIPERHRIIFYLGHLEAFDRNLLRDAGLITSARPQFDELFAFGIDPVGGDLPTDAAGDWPRLETVREYREWVRGEVDAALPRVDQQGEQDGSFGQVLNVAIEHRLMHAETLAYIFHQLPLKFKKGPSPGLASAGKARSARSIKVPAGVASLGSNRESGAFGWDNEFQQHSVSVPGFLIDKYKVTNGDYLEFVNDGGYSARELWKAADWEWLSSHGISHPVFWMRHQDAWWYRAMFGEIPLPFDWPVYVSHAEAAAYARWAGKDLPSEAEWQRATYGEADGSDTISQPGDSEANKPQRWDPGSVDESPGDPGPFGVEGLISTGWEWTSTPFAPFPGFRPFALYPGYSAPFFDGKHFVLKGGSMRTAACMLRSSFRNWFQPHYQYVYAGFRCVSRHEKEKTR